MDAGRPAGLGFAGFALTTFIRGIVNTNAVSGKDVFVVLSVAGACGGLAQLLVPGQATFARSMTLRRRRS